MTSDRAIRWLAAVLLLICGAAPVCAQTSAWVNVRTISTSIDVQSTAQGSLIVASWKQAESVTWYHRATLSGQSYPLTASNSYVILEIMDMDELDVAHQVITGTISSATSGQMIFTLTPEQSNLMTNEYRGYIKYQQTNGSSVVNIGVLAVARVLVEYSPNSTNYSFIGNSLASIRSNAVTTLLIGSPTGTGAVERTGSATGVTYTIRFPQDTGNEGVTNIGNTLTGNGLQTPINVDTNTIATTAYVGSAVSGLLGTGTAASTYASIAALSASGAAHNARMDTFIASATASNNFYPASNPSNYVTGAGLTSSNYYPASNPSNFITANSLSTNLTEYVQTLDQVRFQGAVTQLVFSPGYNSFSLHSTIPVTNISNNGNGSNGGNGDRIVVRTPSGLYRIIYLLDSPKVWSENFSTASTYEIPALAPIWYENTAPTNITISFSYTNTLSDLSLILSSADYSWYFWLKSWMSGGLLSDVGSLTSTNIITAGGGFIGPATGLTSLPSFAATNSQWNASVSGASNLAWAIGVGATNIANAVGLAATNLHLDQGAQITNLQSATSSLTSGVWTVGAVASNAQVTASNAVPWLSLTNAIHAQAITNFDWAAQAARTNANLNSNGVVNAQYFEMSAATTSSIPSTGNVLFLDDNNSDYPSYRRSGRAGQVFYGAWNFNQASYLTINAYNSAITNTPRIYSGIVTQNQIGVHNVGYMSTTNLWLPLPPGGTTNWVKFEGRLNVY